MIYENYIPELKKINKDITSLKCRVSELEGQEPDELDPPFIIVNTYSDLPSPSEAVNKFYITEQSQGTKWLPGTIGGTFYSKGIYYSNGIEWVYAGDIPYQATQSNVNAGIINDMFVTPLTLNNYYRWSEKQDVLISGTNIKSVNGFSLLGSGDIDIDATQLIDGGMPSSIPLINFSIDGVVI